MTALGYEHSGLPTYAIGPDGIYARSYVLYDGRKPQAVRGQWMLRRRMTPAELADIAETIAGRTPEAAAYIVELVADGPRGEPLTLAEALTWTTKM